MAKSTWVGTAGGHRMLVKTDRGIGPMGDPALVRLEIGGETALLSRSDVQALAAALLAHLDNAPEVRS